MAGLCLLIGTHPLAQRAVPASVNAPPAPARVTFARDIAPILYTHCATCHRPGQSAPFNLLTYDDAAQHATLIADATARRYMPPWKPEPGFGDFEGNRRLSDPEIALIQRWVSSGREYGDPNDLLPVPQFATGWTLGTPDLVVTLPAPYLLRAGGPDAFRTFVVPIPISGQRLVRGVEFDPGGTQAIHHANLKIDATHSSRWLDEQDPGPGYEGAGARGAKFPDGYFLGWTPGQSPQTAPEGSAWRLSPSSDLIIELHMLPTGRPERIQPRVALYFTNQPPTHLPSMLRLGRQDLDIPPGASHYVSTDSYVLPVDVTVLRVQPHAHWLATEVRAFATLPGGERKWLIYIKDWDMRWQDVYRLREPLLLPHGTRLTMEYVYDNSVANVRNPSSPPKRVTFGQTSSAEMGDLWLQVMTATDDDRAHLDRDFAPKMLTEDIRGLEKMLEISPGDARLHADLGMCYVESGRTDEAVAQLKTAARMQPASAGAQHDVGVVLLRQRQFEEARLYLEAAVRIKPDFSEAYSNLGVALHAQGKLDEAVAMYTKAIALSASNADAEYNFGRLLATRGDLDGALAHYRRSIEIEPEDPVTQASLASVLALRQQTREAISHYRRALALNPQLTGALLDLAWILATSDQPTIRSPREAITLAERAVVLTDRKSPTALDTLAAALAAAGDFDRARGTAEEALNLASSSGQHELANQIRARLDVYRQLR